MTTKKDKNELTVLSVFKSNGILNLSEHVKQCSNPPLPLSNLKQCGSIQLTFQ